MQQSCQYSQYLKNGLEQKLICSLTGKYCSKQRYCPTKRRLVNTDDWRTCTQLKKEEKIMANTKKKVTEPVKKKAIVEPIEKTEDTVVSEVEPIVNGDKKDSAKYQVILATPTYCVVNKDGINITITNNNNYKKGDMVSLED